MENWTTPQDEWRERLLDDLELVGSRRRKTADALEEYELKWVAACFEIKEIEWGLACFEAVRQLGREKGRDIDVEEEMRQGQAALQHERRRRANADFTYTDFVGSLKARAATMRIAQTRREMGTMRGRSRACRRGPVRAGGSRRTTSRTGSRGDPDPPGEPPHSHSRLLLGGRR